MNTIKGSINTLGVNSRLNSLRCSIHVIYSSQERFEDLCAGGLLGDNPIHNQKVNVVRKAMVKTKSSMKQGQATRKA